MTCANATAAAFWRRSPHATAAAARAVAGRPRCRCQRRDRSSSSRLRLSSASLGCMPDAGCEGDTRQTSGLPHRPSSPPETPYLQDTGSMSPSRLFHLPVVLLHNRYVCVTLGPPLPVTVSPSHRSKDPCPRGWYTNHLTWQGTRSPLCCGRPPFPAPISLRRCWCRPRTFDNHVYLRRFIHQYWLVAGGLGFSAPADGMQINPTLRHHATLTTRMIVRRLRLPLGLACGPEFADPDFLCKMQLRW